MRSTFTSFAHPKAVGGTFLAGINKYNSTVGGYLDSANITHRFKRYSNGGLVSLNYPGASQGTAALGINDYGNGRRVFRQLRACRLCAGLT